MNLINPKQAGLLLSAMLVSASLAAGPASSSSNPGIFPINSVPDGKSYGNWTAAWWQWELSVPAAQNPDEDTTGGYANLNQGGPVWFLPGTFGDQTYPVVRNISVPAGKELFLPVYPWIFGSCAGDCDPSNPGVTCDIPTLRQAAASAATSVLTGSMEVSIDGVPVREVSQYRALSPSGFSVTLPPDNVLQFLGVSSDVAGTYTPQVSDGYWLMLRSLSPGKHTVLIHVINPTFGADQTLVYHLNVEDPILALLQDLYWRNFFGQITVPKDSNGNSAVGNLVLLGVPSAPGDGTPGSIDLTLKSNEAFFLPLWNLLGTSYNDGTPDDPAIALKVYQTLNLKLTLDGTPLLDSGNGNLMDNYSEFKFVPPIPLSADFSPANAFIWLQGISTLHGPLSSGTHVLHLDAKNTDSTDVFGLTIEYHNTWNLTVK